MPDDLTRELVALLHRLTATAEAPDAFARRLLLEPLREPKPKGADASIKLLRDFLRRNDKRVFGLADEVPSEPWFAEVRRSPDLIILSREALIEAFRPKVPVDARDASMGFKATANEIQPHVDAATNTWTALGWVHPTPDDTRIVNAVLAVSAKAVAGAFDTY